MSKKQLMSILTTLDKYRENLSQNEKDTYYKQILELRSCLAKSLDPIGYNQLHWAVLCDQSIEEVNRLINQENVDVNAGTQFTKPIVNFNIQPLYLAVKYGNEKLVKCLLDNNANEEYELKYYALMGPVSGIDYSKPAGEKRKISLLALEEGNATFKFFERKLIEDNNQKISKNPNEYDSMLPTYVASFLYYSNQEVLNAVSAYTELLNREQNTDQWRSELNQLKENDPAVEQGELGEIYHVGLKSRGM